MRIRTWSAALIAVALTATSCSENGIVNPGKTVPDVAGLAVLSGTAKVVISQVYGAGGNGGAALQNDYVELFNAGSASQDLSTWSVQYASAAGTGNLGASSTQLVQLTGSIAAGQYYLIKLKSTAAVGGVLPTADATNLTLDMAGAAGKVAVVDQLASVGCNGGSNPCSATQAAHIIDLVGYGTANYFEGTAAAPAISATLADFRADHGCTDTNVNSADFATGTPSPRNSSTPLAPCGVVIEPTIGPLDHIVVTGGTSVAAGLEITLTAELQDAANKTITDPAATFSWASADDATLHLVSTTGSAATFRGLQPGGPVTITLSATSNAVTKTADPAPTVTVAPGGTIVPSTTFVSEIHYDNTGTDAGEEMEIEGDANSSLTGWSLVMYNGSPGSSSLGVYATVPLSGVIPATCGARGVVRVPFPVNGIQNGDADGWALINAQGQVTELKSYEGTFTATSGPAAGLTSTQYSAPEMECGSAHAPARSAYATRRCRLDRKAASSSRVARQNWRSPCRRSSSSTAPT
jgi:hypothetical protein